MVVSKIIYHAKDAGERIDSVTASLPIAKTPDASNPVASIIHSWLFGIMLPATILAWIITRQWTIAIASAFVIPLLAIAQGALGILTYRLHFGDAPVPITPSHGVVRVQSSSENVRNTQKKHRTMDICSSPSLSASLNNENYEVIPTSLHNASRSVSDQQRPLRVLVIGDSLAIGIGQSVSCTPILPEVVAKTLSRRFNGRTVYWTCHGAPGASTGWIVRELERAGTQHLCKEKSMNMDDKVQSKQPDYINPTESSCSTSRYDCWSDTDESTSDESSSTSSVDESSVQHTHGVVLGDFSIIEESRIWRDRLAQHRSLFGQSEILGPYDVVVVFTGSNDLKSAFFPFLLSGEDAEFRRQASERGGNYHLELRRLLETLQKRMRRLQDRATVVRDNVIKNVEETMERIIQKSPTGAESNVFGSLFRSRKEEASVDKLNFNASATSTKRRTVKEQDQEGKNLSYAQYNNSSNISPLVVLPGLPAQSLPIFQIAPLRWLAVPIVDINDMNKRKLAASESHHVLFVPAPSPSDLASYENGEGDFWKQKCEEEILMSLHDITRRDYHRLQRNLKEYYATKERKSKAQGLFSFLKPLAVRSRPSGLFSIDSIHPNDLGYDFWGRYIANAVADKLQQTMEEHVVKKDV